MEYTYHTCNRFISESIVNNHAPYIFVKTETNRKTALHQRLGFIHLI